MGLPERRSRDLAHADVPELSLGDELAEEGDRLLDRSEVSGDLVEVHLLSRAEGLDDRVHIISEELIRLDADGEREREPQVRHKRGRSMED